MPDEPNTAFLDEQTGPQSLSISAFGVSTLGKNLQASHNTFRTIRRHPTVSLARALQVATVAAAEWSIEADDEVEDERIRFIQGQYMPIRRQFVDTAMRGGIDFGWQGWEQVFEIANGQFRLARLKPLLHDITDILVEAKTGDLVAYQQELQFGGSGAVILPANRLLHIGFRIEGSNWFGESLLENARLTYNQWITTNDAACRYDARIAGAHIIVWYPAGKTNFEGTLTENSTIATDILDKLKASGRFTMPRLRSTPAGEDIGWKLEILTDESPKQVSFISRLEYFDKLLVRSLLTPERSIIEGLHGTKAEASEHAEAAVSNLELTHQHITERLNEDSVDIVLVQNFGEEARGTIRLVASPIEDEKRLVLREVYGKILDDPSAALEEVAMIDTDAIKDKLGVPKRTEVAQAGETGDLPDPTTPEGFARTQIAALNARRGGNGPFAPIWKPEDGGFVDQRTRFDRRY